MKTFTRPITVVNKDYDTKNAIYLETVYSCEDSVTYHYYVERGYNGAHFIAVPETAEDFWKNAED